MEQVQERTAVHVAFGVGFFGTIMWIENHLPRTGDIFWNHIYNMLAYIVGQATTFISQLYTIFTYMLKM